MKKITQKLFLFLSLFSLATASAQVANYSFSTSTGNSLATGSFTNLLGTYLDDNISGMTNIGFTFNYNGIDYTTFSVSSNGLLRFGDFATGQFYNTLNDLNGSYLSPYWDDNYTDADGNVQYMVTGTPGSRKLVVEYNVSYLGTTGTADKHFQIWLSEGSNTIQFVYGIGNNINENTQFGTNGFSVGIMSSNTDYKCITVSNDSSSSIALNDNNSTWPGAGKMYTFNGNVNTFLIGSSCGATISNMSVTIRTPAVAGVSSYMFRVTNMVTNAVFTVTRPVNSFALSNYAGITLGTAYQIEVSTNGGVTYGPPCTVNTPVPAATIGSYCGTTLASMSQWIYATYQASVTGYRFRITNTATNAVEIYNPTSGQNRFSFNQLPTAFRMNGTVYAVEVALRNTDGNYLPYGTACNVTTSGTAPVITRNGIAVNSNEFAAVAYPNPFAENFMFDVKTGSENTIQIKVYDMLGRQVENRNVEASDISNVQFGGNYQSGVYNVIVSQGENTQNLRVIKR